jgi:hypothetical protein
MIFVPQVAYRSFKGIPVCHAVGKAKEAMGLIGLMMGVSHFGKIVVKPRAGEPHARLERVVGNGLA